MDQRKRVFDLIVTIGLLPIWLPVCLLVALALGLTSGWPVLYGSKRRVLGSTSRHVWKFRTMVRNAERMMNRDTVPVTDTCFLNIPPEHPVYTPVGRRVERYALTELPQLLHVLSGAMSLVGNRPLPESVIRELLKRYPYAEDRFLAPAGLTGPVQLIGRQLISDSDRLAVEVDYCLLSVFRYRARLDLAILWNTVRVALHLRQPFTVQEVRSLMAAAARTSSADEAEAFERRRAALRLPVTGDPSLWIDGDDFEVRDIGYRGLKVVGERALGVGRSLSLTGDPAQGDLLARVCWSRQVADGRYETGLAVDPGLGSAMRLIHLVRGSGIPVAFDRDAPGPVGGVSAAPSLAAVPVTRHRS